MDGFLSHYAGLFDQQNLGTGEIEGSYFFWISGFDSDNYEELLEEGGFEWEKETRASEMGWDFQTGQPQNGYPFERYLVEGDDVKITTYLERSCPSNAEIEFVNGQPESLSERDSAAVMFNMEPEAPYSFRDALSTISNGLKKVI